MIKVNNDIYKKFLDIMYEYDEPLFGDDDFLKKQLESCLNIQGFWSGCAIRVYYNDNDKTFSVENKF